MAWREAADKLHEEAAKVARFFAPANLLLR